MTTAVRTIRIDSAAARSDLAQLDARVEALSRALQNLTVDISVNDSQLEDALALVNQIANNPPNIDISVNTAEINNAFDEIADLEGLNPSIDLGVNTSDLDNAFDEIASLEGLSPNIDLQIDSGNLDSALDDLAALESLTPRVRVDVQADGLDDIQGNLDRLGSDQSARIRVEAENLAATDSEIDAVADEDRTAEIDVEADVSTLQATLQALSSPAGIVGAAASAAGAVFGIAFGDALNLDEELGRIEASLSLTGEQSAALGEAAGNLYAGAYGESIGDNLTLLEDLARFELVATADVEDLTRAGGLVQDFANTFEVDAAESISAVQQLVEQGLAPNFEAGLDGLTTALSNSQIPAEEFIAAVGEYAPFLEDAGVGFDDFAQVLISGGASTVIEVDKVGDAIKELGLRVDGLTPEKIDEIAEAAGVSASELQVLTQRLQEGDPGALQDIIEVIQGIEDPAQQAALSIEFFGAAGEDAADILLNADFTTPFETLAGATEAAGNAINDNLGVRLTTLRRTALQGITDFITANVLPTLLDFADALLEIDFRSIIDGVGEFIGSFDFSFISEGVATVGEIFATLSDTLSNIDFEGIGDTLGSIFDNVGESANAILPTIPPLVEQIGSIVEGVVSLAIQFWESFGESIIQFAVASIENLITILGGVFEVIQGVISTVTALLQGDWAGAWEGAQQIVEGVWQVIQGVINQVINEVTAVVNIFLDLFRVDAQVSFSGFGDLVSTVWETVKTVFSASVEFITTVVTAGWDLITTATSAAWEGISTVISTVWDAISTVISTAMTAIQTVVTTAWDAIGTVISTVLSAIQTVITTAWDAYLTYITTVLNAIQTIVTTVWTAIQTVITTVMTAIQTIIQTAWTAIQTVIQTAMTAIQTVITTAWTVIQTVIRTQLTAIQTIITTVWTAIQTIIRTAMTAIQTLITTAWETIRARIQTAMAAIQTVIQTTWTAIQTVIRTAMAAIQTLITTAWDTIRTRVTTAVNLLRTAVTTAFDGLRTGITASVDGIRTSITGAFERVRDSVVRIVQGIRDTVNGIFDGIRIPDFGGVAAAAQNAANAAGGILGNIPFLADGGIIKGGTGQLAVLAENGADELAINAASSLNRKIDLLEEFDGGRLMADLFSYWESQFATDQRAIANEFQMWSAGREQVSMIVHQTIEIKGEVPDGPRGRRKLREIADAAASGFGDDRPRVGVVR